MDLVKFVEALTIPERRELRSLLAPFESHKLMLPEELVLDYIPAIKAVRSRLGLGLKEARDLVDRERGVIKR